MKIYNYLFYKTYLLAKWSKNFDDVPVLGGLLFVGGCVMFNIFTIVGFLEGLGIDTGLEFKREYKFLFSFGLLALVYLYYAYKSRYKKIILYYERKEKGIVSLHPVIVILLYYGTSVFLMFLAAFFKNKDWIFAQ